MVFSNEAPKADGKYRWRDGKGGRVHVVQVRIKKGTTTLKCSTMDVRTLQSGGGEWSLVAQAERTDDELVAQV